MFRTGKMNPQFTCVDLRNLVAKFEKPSAMALAA